MDGEIHMGKTCKRIGGGSEAVLHLLFEHPEVTEEYHLAVVTSVTAVHE